MKAGKWLLLVLAVSVSGVGAQAQSSLDKLKNILAEKDLSYFTCKVPGAPGEYAGVQFLKGVSIILVYSAVPPENREFLDKEVASGNQRGAFRDLHMLRGNSYTLISDFQMDDLKTGDGSGDIVKRDGRTVYLNKDFQSNNFKTDEEYQDLVRRVRADYERWAGILVSQIR